jgi:hypothetical protein
MDDALLMGMLDRLTDLRKQLQACADRQLFFVAVLCDRYAFYQLHDEVRLAAIGRPGV